jgi:hypothetical protein
MIMSAPLNNGQLISDLKGAVAEVYFVGPL